MTEQSTYRINQPVVASELIDGEAVIMNLKTGNYYSARETGGQLWAWLEDGLSYHELLSRLIAAYAGEADAMDRGLMRFIGQLREEELIVEVPREAGTAPLPADPAEPDCERPSFTAPVLDVYADMRDLMLLDPIHDVAEVGWPMAAPTRPSVP